MAASADHTVSIPGATAGKTVLVAVTAAATLVLHSSAVTAGWVQDTYAVNSVGFGVYRLPGASNPGGTLASLRLTHNGAAWLGGVAWQDDITGAATVVTSSSDASLSTLSTLTTGVQTMAVTDVAYVVFAVEQTSTNNSSDVTGFDQGFTEIADSGYLDSLTSENIRMWVAGATNKSLAAAAVNATMSDAGIFGYNSRALLAYAATGGGSGSTPSAWAWNMSLRIG